MVNTPGYLEIITLEECDSTNNYIKAHFELFKERPPVLVTSRLQTRGRGRENRSWVSLQGKGLYTSFGFSLRTHSNLQYLSIVSGISAAEALNRLTTLEFGIKWPNDILFNHKKVAGILIENIISGSMIYSIVGIGINLNHRSEDFPPELAGRATSLLDITGYREEILIEQVNPVLAVTLFHWLQKLESGHIEEIIETANKHSSFLMNRPIAFHHPVANNVDRMIRGIYRGISPEGGLILENETGEGRPSTVQTVYFSGEIV